MKAAVAANINSKSPGLDQIKAKYIKNESCVPFLHKLFKYCFRNGIVPSNWNKSVVIMKTYCRILNSYLSDWIELNSVLSEEQKMASGLAGVALTTFLRYLPLLRIVC